MSICMASINIAIKEEAYDYLKSLKSKDDSFSDVILGFKSKRKGDPKEILAKYFGKLKHVDWKAREKNMAEFRDEFNKRMSNDRS